MTATEPTLCTSAPRTGFRIPVLARAMARKFSAMDAIRLILIVCIVFFARCKRGGISLIY